MNAIPKIFIDDQLQDAFDREGYVTLPLVSSEDVERLKVLFFKYHTERADNAFQSSTFLDDKAYKVAISNDIQEIVLPYFKQFLCNFEALGSSFLFKTKGMNSELAAHQDWTIVDERKDIAMNVWIPLSDTNEKNGTLYVLPRSHSKYLFTLRAPTIPFFFEKHEHLIKQHLVPIPTKAGSAIVLNESLIHYSSANVEDDIRIAITSGVINQNAPMVFHYMNDKKEIERFSVERDFLLSIEGFHKNIFERPAKLHSLGLIQEPLPILSQTQLETFIQTQKVPDVQQGWWEKIKTVFQ